MHICVSSSAQIGSPSVERSVLRVRQHMMKVSVWGYVVSLYLSPAQVAALSMWWLCLVWFMTLWVWLLGVRHLLGQPAAAVLWIAVHGVWCTLCLCPLLCVWWTMQVLQPSAEPAPGAGPPKKRKRI